MLESKAILIRKGQSYRYPKHFLLMEYKVKLSVYNKNIIYLRLCQLIPAKKGWALIYSTPFTPNLSLGSQTSFLNINNILPDKISSLRAHLSIFWYH